MTTGAPDNRSRPYGFAIVGCGVIGPTHAEAVRANGARVVGFHDELRERAEALAERFGGRPYSTLDELLADPEVDAVTVATPSGQHADAAIPAARAGKHLLVEKPLDVTLERARRIVDEAARADVRLSVVSQHRFDDGTQAAKAALDAGRLGRVVFAQAQVLWYRSQTYYDRDEWRGTWALDGGGALMNQSIHSIDLLRYLAGDIESVRGATATIAHHSIEVEDIGVATVRFRSGALGTIVGTTAVPPGFGARVEIYGERGAARIVDDNLVFLGTAEAMTQRESERATPASNPASVRSQGHVRQVADLIEAIAGHRAPAIDGEEGLRALELVLAIYESARTGLEVRLPPDRAG